MPVRRTKISVYMFCGSLLAGIAGILEVGWLGGVTTNLGQGMELQRDRGGGDRRREPRRRRRHRVRRVVGAALIEVIRNSLTLLGISTFWQGSFVGSFIVIASPSIGCVARRRRVAIERLAPRRYSALPFVVMSRWSVGRR